MFLEYDTLLEEIASTDVVKSVFSFVPLKTLNHEQFDYSTDWANLREIIKNKINTVRILFISST